MTPPIRPESSNPRLNNLRKIAEGYRAQGATADEIAELIRTYHPELQAQAPEPMGALDKVRGGLQSGLQGATFNFADEIVAGGRALASRIPGGDEPISFSDALADERASLGQFREANPKTALGLELGGGLLSGLGAAGLAAKGATGLNAAARIAASGAGGGALAGAGAGETMGGRAAGALGYGAAGGLLGAGLGKMANSRVGDYVRREGGDLLEALTQAADGPASYGVPRGTGQVANAIPEGFNQSAGRIVAKSLGDKTGKMDAARDVLAELEAAGMGKDVLALNLGGDPAARSARALANVPSLPFARTNAKGVLDEALARQGGALGAAVADDIGVATGMGGTPGPIRLAQMQKDLSAKVDAGYKAFRALPEVPLDPNDEAQRLFLERYVNPVIQNKQLTGNLSGSSALSGENVDAAFKNLQRELRGVETAVNMGTRNVNEAGNLKAIRDRVLAAIGQTDPNYAELARTYALDEDVGKVVQEAFETGMSLPPKPVGTGTVALEETTDAGREAMRAGFATDLQRRAGEAASNPDLAEMAKFRDAARVPVANIDDAARFKEMFGDDAYNTLLGRLSPKIRAAAMNAAVRGNSSTARQLLDAMQLGDNAVLEVLESGARGGAMAMGRNIASMAYQPLRALATGQVGQTAEDAARLFATRGAAENRSLLDVLEQIGQADVARSKAVQPVAGALVGRYNGPR